MLNSNQEGFVLPMTLIISTLVIIFFISQVELLMTDRIYYHELEEKRSLDNLMDISIRDVVEQLNSGIDDSKFTKIYQDGSANYTIYRNEIDVHSWYYQVYITCVIENGQKFSLVFKYDPVLERIYNLVEAVIE